MAAAAAFLAACALAAPVLSGGVTVLDNVAQANSEIDGTAADLERQPVQFQARRAHDWRLNQQLLRTHLRRVYAITLLGPALAAQAGGAVAARTAGATAIREVAGALLFHAVPGPPLDSLDPAFLAATASVRSWLWPLTSRTRSTPSDERRRQSALNRARAASLGCIGTFGKSSMPPVATSNAT